MWYNNELYSICIIMYKNHIFVSFMEFKIWIAIYYQTESVFSGFAEF
jgi:hypothetical protein